jgi:hypothetical protein
MPCSSWLTASKPLTHAAGASTSWAPRSESSRITSTNRKS